MLRYLVGILYLTTAVGPSFAQTEEKKIIEEVPSVTEDPTPPELEQPLTDKEPQEPVEAESEVEGSLEPQNNSDLVDLNLTLGKRWFDESPFAATGLQLTIEWSLPDLPIRLGPAIRYFDLTTTGDFWEEGKSLEFGLRTSYFIDMENYLPYIALDYTFAGSGSLKGHSTIDGTEISAALNSKTTGYDLLIGTSIFFDDFSLVIEASLTNKVKLDLDGSITTAQEQTDNTITVTATEAEDIDEDTFRSIHIGMGFEF